jgi:hypothetical protein
MLWSDNLQSLSALYTRSIRLMMGIAKRFYWLVPGMVIEGWADEKLPKFNSYIRKLRKKGGKKP